VGVAAGGPITTATIVEATGLITGAGLTVTGGAAITATNSAITSGTLTTTGVITADDFFVEETPAVFTGFKSIITETTANTSGLATEVALQAANHTAQAAAITTLEAAAVRHAFQATSGLNADQVLSVGVVADFDQLEFCEPTGDYSTATAIYTCPVAGWYVFGFKLFIQSSGANLGRVGLYKNGALAGHGGSKAGFAEDITICQACSAGDEYHVAGSTGTINAYMGANHSWFWGHRI